MASSSGELLSNEVKKIVKSIADELKVEVKARTKEISGRSAYWKPDIVVVAKHVISDSLLGDDYSLYLAIIECKYIGGMSLRGYIGML